MVVVGAGLAGLGAARRLADAGREVLVVEARDRVGGRLLGHDLGDGTVVELGGQWVGPTQDRVNALVRELGLTTFPTYVTGDHLAAVGGDVRRYRGGTPPFSPIVLADLLQAQRRLERMARQVPLDAPWAAPRARSWDAETFDGWLRRNVATATGRTFFRIVADAVFASDASTLSLLHLLFYVHSGRGLDRLLGTAGGAQQDRVVGGSQLLAVGLADRLGPRVRQGHPVRRLDHRGGRVRVFADGLEVEARRAIVAVPPTLAGRIAYDPPLPGARDQLTQRMPMGAVVKCMAVYERPWWRDEGLSGSGATDVAPVGLTFDNSPPGGTLGVLLAFVEGRHAVALGRVSPGDRRRAVIDALVRLYGSRAAAPVDYVERDWAAEEWSRGCYGAHLPPGAWTQLGPDLRRPVGRIHWAGTETAEVWSGYMDGALESGDRAAAEVLAALAGGG